MDLPTLLSVVATGIAVYGVLHQVTDASQQSQLTVIELRVELHAAQQRIEDLEAENAKLKEQLHPKGGITIHTKQMDVSGDVVAGDEIQK